MKFALSALLVASMPVLAVAQESAPPDISAAELARSRRCVAAIANVDRLEAQLAPIDARFQRLAYVARIVAEERFDEADSLRVGDPLERDVRAWLVEDHRKGLQLAQTPDSALAARRAAEREAIKARVDSAGGSVRDEAAQALDAGADVQAAAAQCEGVVFVRSAILEACASQSASVCEAARAEASPEQRFRFVDAAQDLWDMQQVRPWADPNVLRIGPQGLAGGQSGAMARVGNIALSVTLGPLIQQRAQLTPEQISLFEARLDTFDIDFESPRLLFTPALEVRTNLFVPLAGETFYLLHFGDAEAGDVLWRAPSVPGQAPATSLLLSAEHLERLQAGEALRWTAVSDRDSAAGPRALYTVELTTGNQVAATTALMGYMTDQFGQDLIRLTESGGD